MTPTGVPQKVREAITDEEIIACYPVLKELKPVIITSESVFLQHVRLQQKEGFHLLYIEDKVNDEPEVRPVSILGYVIMHNLFDGRFMYLSDVSTLPEARRKGYASELSDRAVDIAREQDCVKVILDSRYQNKNAHRFYLNKGFCMTAHHCAHDLD